MYVVGYTFPGLFPPAVLAHDDSGHRYIELFMRIIDLDLDLDLDTRIVYLMDWISYTSS